MTGETPVDHLVLETSVKRCALLFVPAATLLLGLAGCSGDAKAAPVPTVTVTKTVTTPGPTVTVTASPSSAVSTWPSALDVYKDLQHDKACESIDPNSIEWALNCSPTR